MNTGVANSSGSRSSKSRSVDPTDDALRDELTRLASTYAAAMRLDTDITAMNGQPPGMPALLMAEAVRELLNNASYHRYGYPARLTGWSSATQVEVSVHNDGPGVDPRRLASAWALKQNIIHQFEAAGGSYHIRSAPETDGTTLATLRPGVTTCDTVTVSQGRGGKGRSRRPSDAASAGCSRLPPCSQRCCWWRA